ncbi:M23 family metallopeptidase [Pontibacillus sp. HMF3514]|uniref:M23 family metallopeptidase n=1 Tax=Pontibacillus sp. HMF3514 TaxID=2692425 RepID=UPI00131F8E20|nr:M23 family metallopeptidase [Pontibacillus sp. HMF3514]QHE53882.1 peptidoglycan DD-metalloendopeptidase family protein [Pontibacillus sp. HMF3514]
MKRLLKYLTGSWTFMVMSNAQKRVFSIKIPRAIGYLFTLFILSLGTALFFTYQQANSLETNSQTLSNQLMDKQEELKTLQSKYQTLLSNANQTKQKIDKLVTLQQEMNQLVSNDNQLHKGKGGDNLNIQQLNYSSDEQSKKSEKVEDLQTIQQSIPTLVNEYKETVTELKSVQKELARLPSIWPTSAREITSKFGGRSDPFTKSISHHKGLDIAGPYRTEIYATADGLVKEAGRNGGYGNFISIKHSSEYTTQYAHLDEIFVEPGEKVKKGDKIGAMGTTGRSTGVHLHYEILINGKHVNPLPYVLVGQ